MVIRFAFPGRFVEYAQYFDMDYRVYTILKVIPFILVLTLNVILIVLARPKDVLNVLEGGSINFEKVTNVPKHVSTMLLRKKV